MSSATWILFAMAVLGASDIWFFHMGGHRLRSHPPAWKELVTHALRGPTYAALFLCVPNFEFRGAWFGALLCVLAFDLVLSIVDFWLEPESRRAKGGLPRGEYLLHVGLAALFGALVTTVLRAGETLRSLPTELVWTDDGAPLWLRIVLACLAPITLGSGIVDAFAARRLAREARSSMVPA